MAQITSQKDFRVEKLKVKIYPSREKMGVAAARETARIMKQVLSEKDQLVMIFAAAPSQNEFLAELVTTPNLDWSKVIAFHMDEYIGLSATAPQLFANFLRNAIMNKVPIKQFHAINGNAPDIMAECLRYTALLKTHPVDICCLGIGENGHLAFNDPPFTNFNDSAWVKVIELDDISRQQQVNDGCFDTFEAVPAKAITLTIPALLSAKWITCVVPAKSKARAIEKTLRGKISPDCPASVLRTCENATLYLDPNSASKLKFES
ncbi:glucosamine-6-phosphate deaminase [candidate division KSB1 bacterium]|nr:glucosamine-6-phosphate deaminase [candidate division KSB1 bacterium]